MRRSEFQRLMDEEFGARGGVLVRDHVIAELGHRTAEQAIEDGESLQQVWFAICRDLEIPQERWWGSDPADKAAAGRRGRATRRR